MKYLSPLRLAAAPLAALALAACATPAYVSPVEVTRFVAEQPGAPQPGPIGLGAGPGLDPGSLEFSIYRDAVAEQLESLGFTVTTEDPPIVAIIELDQVVKQPGYGRRSPVSVGGAASTGSYGSGVGVGIGINLNSLSGPDPDEIDSRLAVSIRPAEGGTALWEGRALMTATSNSDYADSNAAAARLATALFRDFPGNDGETVEIK